MKEYLTPKLLEGQTVDLSLYEPRERTNIRLYGLKCKDWTPRDVFEYKTSWIPNAEAVNTFNLESGQVWCKLHLYMQDWHVVKYAKQDDSHNFLFKHPQDAMLFKLTIT
jgi:hypothetical protein